MERMNVHLCFSSFKVNVAKRLKRIWIIVRELYEQTAVATEAFEIDKALAIEVLAHFFDLEVRHITESAA